MHNAVLLRVAAVGTNAPRRRLLGRVVGVAAEVGRRSSSSASAFKYEAPWLERDAPSSSGGAAPIVKNFINGSFVLPDDDQKTTTTIPLYDPSTNELLSRVPESHHSGGATLLCDAISAAKGAFPSWSNTPVQVRQRLMLEYAHHLHRVEVREEVAQLSGTTFVLYTRRHMLLVLF